MAGTNNRKNNRKSKTSKVFDNNNLKSFQNILSIPQLLEQSKNDSPLVILMLKDGKVKTGKDVRSKANLKLDNIQNIAADLPKSMWMLHGVYL